MFLVSLVCLQEAWHPAWFKSLLSVFFFLSLIRWIGSSCLLALFRVFPVSFIKRHVQGRFVFVPALPIMSCVPTFRTPSSHDITPSGSHHHGVVGVGNHGSGMPVTQGGGTAIWLGNCLVPDICGKQAECHFKQWPVNSDLRWEANCSYTNHNMVACQPLHHSPDNPCIQNNKPPAEMSAYNHARFAMKYIHGKICKRGSFELYINKWIVWMKMRKSTPKDQSLGTSDFFIQKSIELELYYLKFISPTCHKHRWS